MKKIYELEELSCPNCADILAKNLQKIDFIEEVHINYNTKQVEIISEKELTDSEVSLVINTVLSLSHCHKHTEALEITEEFNFENIDCPNCAMKVEDALNKQDDIIDAKVSFMNKKIIIKHKDNVEVFETVSRVLSDIETDAYLVGEHHHHDHDHHECSCHHHHHHHHDNERLSFLDNIFKVTTDAKLNIILGIIGVIIFIAGVVLKIMKLYPEYLLYIFVTSYVLVAFSLIFKTIKSVLKGKLFNEDVLMLVASTGAMIVGEPIEAVMIVVLSRIGEMLQARAVRRSKNAIADMMDMHVDYVTMANFEKVDIKDVLVGEEIIVRVGERIPLDGIITSGVTELNTSALTGESMPLSAKAGDKVLSGCINLSEVIKIEVTTTDKDSTITKVLKLVEEASDKKSKTEEFITKFSKFYTPIVILLAFLVFLVPTIINPDNLYDYLHRACMFLVISCPCALVISIPLGYFGGIGLSSKNGILVKGGNYLEALTKAKTIVFDKTGTLTKGSFYVSDINPVGMSKASLVEIVAHLESYSLHPIAKSIIEHYDDDINKDLVKEVTEMPGKGIKGMYDGKLLIVGKDNLMNEYKIEYQKVKSSGTVVYAALDGKYLGNIIIKDEIRDESKKLINNLHKKGIKTIMLTGDNDTISKEVSTELGIDEYYASLLPQDKLEHLTRIIKNKKIGDTVVFVGDGINDTPALKLADVGIALGDIDAAINAADIVLMNSDISKVNSSINISKFTKKIVIQNIVFALVVKVLALVVAGVNLLGTFGMYLAVLSDVGVCLITILNTLRIIYKKVKK